MWSRDRGGEKSTVIILDEEAMVFSEGLASEDPNEMKE